MLLYILLLSIPFILVASRRGDRFAPFFPPVAVICAWAAVYGWRPELLLRASVAAVPAVILGLAIYFLVLSEQAKDRSGQHMLDFVRAVKAKADDRPLLFCKTANRGLAMQAFLGANQRGLYPREAPASGAWVISEAGRDEPGAAVKSQPVRQRGQRLYATPAAGGSPICGPLPAGQ
jgi:hypothetical protein